MSRASRALPLAFFLLAAPAVFAHSGGQDANGCHTNSQTGDYHCHGAPAPSVGPSSPSGSYSSSPQGPYRLPPGQFIRVERSQPIAAPRAPKPAPAPQSAALVSVGDGDTIRVATANGKRLTIRLACVDAPETAQGYAGADSRANLAQLLQGATLEIRPQTTDKYGRTVAEVFANGRNVNLAMVQSGQAFAYRKYLSGCDQSAYLSAEQAAERQRVGVWRYPGAVQRPWEFRESRRN